MFEFHNILIDWYNHHRRELPWRNTRDPYKIWVSEIILQQTRIIQGLAYYNRFTELFPTVLDLADAEEELVLKTWQGLGYYSRARNMHKTAKIIAEKFNGRFPADYPTLLRLPGIGEYTAAAIASLAFDRNHAVVDGNVYRVLSRYFGISTPIDTGNGKKEFAALAGELINPQDPGSHNQAIMDFGALQCVPVNPACGNCPFSGSCSAYSSGQVSELPLKSKKSVLRDRYLYYLIILHEKQICMQKRGSGDIWQNLYEFPLVGSAEPLNPEELINGDEWRSLFKSGSLHIEKISDETVHLLSHQRLHLRFYTIHTNIEPVPPGLIKITLDKAHELPVPKPVEKELRRIMEEIIF